MPESDRPLRAVRRPAGRLLLAPGAGGDEAEAQALAKQLGIAEIDAAFEDAALAENRVDVLAAETAEARRRRKPASAGDGRRAAQRSQEFMLRGGGAANVPVLIEHDGVGPAGDHVADDQDAAEQNEDSAEDLGQQGSAGIETVSHGVFLSGGMRKVSSKDVVLPGGGGVARRIRKWLTSWAPGKRSAAISNRTSVTAPAGEHEWGSASAGDGRRAGHRSTSAHLVGLVPAVGDLHAEFVVRPMPAASTR